MIDLTTPIIPYVGTGIFKLDASYDEVKALLDGKLPNGIHTGMTIEEALEIDKNLRYNDDNDELYESPDGYWLDYHRGTRKILTILIFIPALERDDFFEYKW